MVGSPQRVRVESSLDLQCLRGLRALVVDDQETSRVIMFNLFQAWGMNAETATARHGLS